MTLTLTDSLEAYRRADTIGWATCAKRLSDNIGEWAAERLESTQASDVLTPESADGAQISDRLLDLMLAPDFVSGLLSADIRQDRMERLRQKTEPRIRADLTEHILNLLTTSFLSGRDFGTPIKPDGRYVSFKLFSMGSDIPWLAEAVFGQAALHDQVCKIVDEDTASPKPPHPAAEPRIVRLDVIDAALYKTLQGHPELLKTLDWRTFEKLLADMLQKLGYEIELQRGTKDGGVDLFAIKRDIFGPQRYLLQAKRWNHNVGVEPIRQLAFLHGHHKMTKSCLATTAHFTPEALELGSQYQWQLELRDFDGLKQWLSHLSPQFVV